MRENQTTNGDKRRQHHVEIPRRDKLQQKCWRCSAPVRDGTRFKGRYACPVCEPELNKSIVTPATGYATRRMLDRKGMRVEFLDSVIDLHEAVFMPHGEI